MESCVSPATFSSSFTSPMLGPMELVEPIDGFYHLCGNCRVLGEGRWILQKPIESNLHSHVFFSYGKAVFDAFRAFIRPFQLFRSSQCINCINCCHFFLATIVKERLWEVIKIICSAWLLAFNGRLFKFFEEVLPTFQRIWRCIN